MDSFWIEIISTEGFKSIFLLRALSLSTYRVKQMGFSFTIRRFGTCFKRGLPKLLNSILNSISMGTNIFIYDRINIRQFWRKSFKGRMPFKTLPYGRGKWSIYFSCQFLHHLLRKIDVASPTLRTFTLLSQSHASNCTLSKQTQVLELRFEDRLSSSGTIVLPVTTRIISPAHKAPYDELFLITHPQSA